MSKGLLNWLALGAMGLVVLGIALLSVPAALIFSGILLFILVMAIWYELYEKDKP